MLRYRCVLIATTAVRAACLTTRPGSIVTLTAVCRHEEVIGKKNKFVALAAPVHSAQDADQFVKELSDPKARHNCFAWKLANGDTRTNGDGEPGGTAGPPILAAISGAGLHDVAVIVSRYRLGEGAKLGTGGLVRAYGGTAAQCLSVAETVALESRVEAVVRFGAEDTGAVYAALAAYSPTTVMLPTEPPETLASISISIDEIERLAQELRSATAGRVTCERLDEEDEEEDDGDFEVYDPSDGP